jgi:uncharacterized protein (TIGR02246 family)
MAAATPEDVSAAFAAALNAGDVPAALELWSEEATMVAPSGQAVRGRDAIAGILETLVGNGTSVEIELSSLIAAGDTAIATGELRMRARGQQEVQTATSVVVYSRGGDGCWRVAIDAPWGLPSG